MRILEFWFADLVIIVFGKTGGRGNAAAANPPRAGRRRPHDQARTVGDAWRGGGRHARVEAVFCHDCGHLAPSSSRRYHKRERTRNSLLPCASCCIPPTLPLVFAHFNLIGTFCVEVRDMVQHSCLWLSVVRCWSLFRFLDDMLPSLSIAVS